MTHREILLAWTRTRATIDRLADMAMDYGLAVLDHVLHDLLVLDAGVFVLLFGVLEQILRYLAVTRATTERDKAHYKSRDCSLDRVLKQVRLAPEVAKGIRALAEVRNDAAHGRGLAASFDIPALVDHIDAIQALVTPADTVSPPAPAGKPLES